MKKETYDRAAVGIRLKERRKQMGWDRKYVAGKAGLAEKYYADIERGTCGMSVETLMALAKLYELSIDSLLYSDGERPGLNREQSLDLRMEQLPKYAQDYCRKMLLLFMEGMQAGEKQNEKK